MSEAKIKEGGPAFPIVRMPIDPDTILNHPGMSLRDWFAGQAIGGLVASNGWNSRIDMATKDAYLIADAMLAARNAK